MTKTELLRIADRVYPDGLLWLYYMEPDAGHGDTLAKFIASELAETFDEHELPDVSPKVALRHAIAAMRAARCDILVVERALSDALRKHARSR
jgi:hypothetical protein